MNELVYLLRVADDEALLAQVAKHLMLREVPEYVRVATLAPFSNFGYPPEAEGALLGWTAAGLVIGIPDNTSIPRAFLPWQNIAYVADGDLMKEYSDYLAQNPQGSLQEFMTTART